MSSLYATTANDDIQNRLCSEKIKYDFKKKIVEKIKKGIKIRRISR
jgi:hypothetical protein